MKKRPERETKLLLVPKIENQERIILTISSQDARISASLAAPLESIALKEMFSAQSSRACRTGPWDRPGKTRRRVMVIGLDCAAPDWSSIAGLMICQT